MAIRKHSLALFVTAALFAASCGSTAEVAEPQADEAAVDETAEGVVEEAVIGDAEEAEIEETVAEPPAAVSATFEIVLPDGWTIVQELEAVIPPPADFEFPENPGLVCPDGSSPRTPLTNVSASGLAQRDSDQVFAPFVITNWESEEAASAYLATWGEGKCEFSFQTVGTEVSAEFVMVDSAADVQVPSGLDNVAVVMTPEDITGDPNGTPEAIGVLVVQSGSEVLLMAPSGSDDLEAVLQELAQGY